MSYQRLWNSRTVHARDVTVPKSSFFFLNFRYRWMRIITMFKWCHMLWWNRQVLVQVPAGICWRLLRNRYDNAVTWDEYTDCASNVTCKSQLCSLFVEVNNCQNVVCFNDGTCLDGPISFECQCAPGFTGDYCLTSTCPAVPLILYICATNTWHDFDSPVLTAIAKSCVF